VYLIPDKVDEIIKRHEGLANYQILIDRPRFQDRVTIRVETEHPKEALRIKQALTENLRAVTQLTAEIDLVPMGAIEQDAPVVIDKRFSDEQTTIGWRFER